MERTIEQRVMAGVGVMYLVRRLVRPRALKVYILAASLITMVSLVSLPHILANLLAVGIAGLPDFALTAVLRTGVAVQIGLVLCLITLGSFFRDMLRSSEQSALAL